MKLLVLLLVLSVSGCSMFAAMTGVSFDQRLACAYGRQTAVARYTERLRDARIIAPEDAEQLLALTEMVKQILNEAAQSFARGYQGLAEKRMELALGVLDNVIAFHAMPGRAVKNECRSNYPMTTFTMTEDADGP